MRLEPRPRPDQVPRVSARLITSSTILHLSSDELERTVNQEQIENPALDVAEQRVCLFCGTRIYGSTCSACGHFAQPTQSLPHHHEQIATYEPVSEGSWLPQMSYDMDNYGFAQIDSEDDYDPLARIPVGETLTETLLQQLEALVAPDDAPIAEQLVGNLNERGYLEVSIEEIARHLQVPIERVSYVLSQLQTLEPLGIGARNAQECLLIQLDVLKEQQTPHPLARTLILTYFQQLGRNQFHEIARKLKVSEQDVREAVHYIRRTLHPHPAHIYRSDTRFARSGSGTTYIRPDMVIRRGPNGFEVELIEEKRYEFHIEATSYSTQNGRGKSNKDVDEGNTGEYSDQEIQRYLQRHSDRARFFVDCIHRRWRTLKRVAELVVDYQREFLEKGIRYLRPLTRAEVATRLNLDEGTVSRATANKYALLPNGRLMPFSDFFDGSLSIKDILRELIQSEDPRHRFSDDELARLLTQQGIPMARRTVTKYREEMGIGTSRERG